MSDSRFPLGDERFQSQQFITGVTNESTAGDEPSRLPAIPGGSRVDNLPQDFLQVLSRRPLMPGEVIASRYKLVETLGNGSMGQVFVGEIQSIGRRVAIKVLRPELLVDAQFRRRFQHEAEAVAALEHRNVARCLDLVVGDPTFLVMEYVAGPSLAKVIGNGRLPPVRAINIARRLCWALESAHRQGVIHRDLKPSNVILAPDVENSDEPKLIDFALAKVTASPYLSPEQRAGKAVDARSDVYSLGCILYEMVTGAPPPADGEVAPPSASVEGVPPQLDAVIARCLARDPAGRFKSMQEMAGALGGIDRRRMSGRHGGARGGVSWGFVLGAFAAGALATAGGMFLGTRAAADDGSIVVTSKPAGGRVEIDGRHWKQTTPTAVTGLRAGEHEIRVQVDGRQAVEQSVTLERGGHGAVDALLPEK